jgi:cytoskeletal protein CcmA (bactofilin family)
MFSKTKNPLDSKGQASQGLPSATAKVGKGGFSVLGPSLRILGDVIAEEAVHLEGSLEGTLTCDSLVVGAQGRFKGRLRAREARVAGVVEGALFVEKLSAETGACISGEIHYSELTVAAGARLEGPMRYATTFEEESLSEGVATPTLKTVS